MLNSPVTFGMGGGVTMLMDATSTAMLATDKDTPLSPHWVFNSALQAEAKEFPLTDALMSPAAGIPGRTTTLKPNTSTPPTSLRSRVTAVISILSWKCQCQNKFHAKHDGCIQPQSNEFERTPVDSMQRDEDCVQAAVWQK